MVFLKEMYKVLKMIIIVTGGAGFIGSNFIFHMLKNHPNDCIICLDKLTYAGNLCTLRPIMNQPNFSFVKADICDRDAIYRIFEDEHPDIVVNFAAESHVDRSIDSPSIFYQTNVLGTVTLLEACRTYGIKRFHQVSTDEVYGDLPLTAAVSGFKENDLLRPSSPYSSSKAAADLAVLSYHRTYGIPVTISRSSNNYGKFQHTEKLIPKMIKLALKNKPLPLYGDGSNVRDWLYVHDHCRAIDMILQHGRVGEIYNVGAGEERSNLEIVHLICRILNKPESLIQFVEDRKGHDVRYSLDVSKIHNELGWSPETAFDVGMAETIQWYEEKYGENSL